MDGSGELKKKPTISSGIEVVTFPLVALTDGNIPY
jgi:hypothetical protein